jgi:hypothetical protein
MKGLLAWNGAAVAGVLVVWVLHEHFGPGSMVLAFCSAVLVYAVLMSMDRFPKAVLFMRDAAGRALIGVGRRCFTFGLRLRVLAQPAAEGGKGELSVTITKRRAEA